MYKALNFMRQKYRKHCIAYQKSNPQSIKNYNKELCFPLIFVPVYCTMHVAFCCMLNSNFVIVFFNSKAYYFIVGILVNY